jgi:DDE superfamily endonuclease
MNAQELFYRLMSCNFHFQLLTMNFVRLAIISSYEVIDGCVACLDGLLLPIQTPATTETGHVKSYFSGHYQAYYGINVQAACDAHCRFVYASLAAHGGTNDIVAF